eukprot:GHVU01193929.1.p1 GENE.GHVU01193929.1~~GHVU01193929.1.p1  ORF type:complete len:239 (+),score=70.09 GHVU01193929.1:180-896(+)
MDSSTNDEVSRDMRSFVGTALDKLRVDVETYSDYVFSILEDEATAEEDEKVQCIVEVLGAAVEGDVSAEQISEFAAEVVKKWLDEKETQGVIDEEKAREDNRERLGQALRAAPSISEPQREVNEDGSEEAKAAKQMEKMKKKVLKEYGTDFEETIEYEDGTLLIPASSKGKTRPDNEDDMWRNDNKDQGARLQREKNVKAKLEHDKQVAQQKAAKELDKLKKEKEKQRCAKKERRAGR